LLLNEIAEFLGLQPESKFPSECFKDVINLLHEYENDSENNQVEKGELNDEEEEVNQDN
jgi:hypothetical protein